MLLNEISSLWQESVADPDFRFELKAQKISVDLSSAVAKSGMSQKELADKLGWKTSRVSKVLHGGGNLTLRTLFEISEALKTDFDIQFGGNSQLKQQMEVVKVKTEQLDKMLAIKWRNPGRATKDEQSGLVSVLKFVS